MNRDSPPQVLDDITVVDISPMLPGHFCSMILGDLGARVIKIERPITGDYSRHNGLAGSFESVNRNKESLTLNLKTADAQRVLHRLIQKADVIVEGFRPGVAARLRCDFELAREIRPKIIYCSISGFGSTGPYRDLPGHDPNYLSYAGVLSLAGEPNGPPSSYVGVSMADLSAAWFAAISVLAAIRARDRHSFGQYIDMSLTDASYALIQNRMTEYLVNDGIEKSDLMSRPGIGLFVASDGLSLTVAAIEQHFWVSLCRAVEADDLLEDPALQSVLQRRTQGERIRSRLEDIFTSKTRDDWLQELQSVGVPCAPVNSLGEASRDPNAIARRIVESVDHPVFGKLPIVRFPPIMSKTPATIRRRPPLLGEHTDDILRELDFSPLEIEELVRNGCV